MGVEAVGVGGVVAVPERVKYLWVNYSSVGERVKVAVVFDGVGSVEVFVGFGQPATFLAKTFSTVLKASANL
jgi:hypothetical protein